MSRLVTVRTASRLGAWTARIARSLAGRLQRSGPAASKYQIVDGFVLQARRFQERCSALIVDLPGFIYFAGFNDFNTLLGRSNQTAVGVGTRDDFDRRNIEVDAGLTYQAKLSASNRPAMMLLPFSGPPETGFPSAIVTLAPTVQDRAMLSGAFFQASLLQSAGAARFDPLDDMDYFTYASPATVGGGALVPFICGVGVGFDDDGYPSIGAISRDYLAQQGFWVSEAELPDGWKLHTRRLVSHTQYSTVNDPFRDRNGPGLIQPGFCPAVAQDRSMDAVDRFCVAARIFRQHQGTWFKSPPGTAYRPPYYDRNGEQGLVVGVGAYDRSAYDPANPPARAAIQVLQLVVPTDLPLADLHPKPELLPTWHAYDMPDLPNFGEFLVPHVARAGDGFAVFSVYRTQRDENPREEESPNEDLIGPAYSLVTTIAGGASYTLLADWDYGEGGSPIETSTPDSFRQPWIVGACHWMQQAGGQERPTAYCLVWEHLYRRRGRGDPNSNRGMGGGFVLYRTDGSAPVRVPVEIAAAPLFAPSMDRGPGDPFVVSNSRSNFAGRTDGPGMLEPFSEVQYLGAGKIVTAVIGSPYPQTGQDRVSQAAHDIQCMVVDLETGVAELTGSIAGRTRAYTKCLISVVQHLVEPSGDGPGHPAVLLATVVDHVSLNFGAAGKVLISFDTGETWREYITDLGGQAGAFYIGNKLWQFDCSKPLTKGTEA